MNKFDRKFSLKRLFSIPILLVMFIIFGSTQVFAANNIPEATEEFYVNDFAGIFTDSQKIEMIEKAEELASIGDYGYQVVVTTVKTLNGVPIEDYSIKMAEQYKIGKDGHGILILLATEDRGIRVEIGIGMEDLFTDSKAGRFIDKYAIPDLANNKFADGIIKLQNAIIEEISSKVVIPKETPKPTPTQQSTVVPEKNNTSKNYDGNEFWAAASFLLSLVACAIVFIFINNRHEKNVKREEKLEKAEKELESLRIESKKSLDRISSLSDTCSEHERYISSYKSEISDLNNQISQYKSKLREAEKNYQRLGEKNEDLGKKYNDLSECYRRAKVLHPDLDKEIENMIAKEIEEANRAKAKAFDEKASKYLEKTPEPNSMLILELSNLIYEYNQNLSTDQKSYSNTDMKKIEDLLAKCRDLKLHMEADNITKQIKEALANKSYGTEEDLPKLNEIRNIYKNSDSKVRNLVDPYLVSKLFKFIDEGEKERKSRINHERANHISKQIEIAMSINGHVTENDLPKLYDAKIEFYNADFEVKNLVDSNLIIRLSTLIEEGEEDKKRRIKREKEEAERRRREEAERKRREEEERRRREEEEEERRRKRRQEEEEERRRRQEEEERRRSSSYHSSSSFGRSSSFGNSGSHSSSSSHHNSGMGGGFRGGGSSRSF